MRAFDPEVLDAIWAAIEPLMPVPIDRHPLGCHRPRTPDRDCFTVIARTSHHRLLLGRRRTPLRQQGLRHLAVDAAYRALEIDSADLARKICDLVVDGLSTTPQTLAAVAPPATRQRAAKRRSRKAASPKSPSPRARKHQE